MTKKKILQEYTLLCLVALMIVPCAAQAEYYKYLDSNGVVCYTDDLSTVPVDSRVKIESFRGIITMAGPTEAVEKVLDDSSENPPPVDQEIVDEQAAVSEVTALQQEKDRLDANYQALKNQRDALMLEGSKTMAKKDFNTYNAKVADLNERMRVYEQAKALYLDKVKAYYQSHQ